jgi:lipopolysaccharide export system protein LptA
MIGTNNYMLFEAEGLEIWSDEAEVLGVATATTPREVKFAGHVRFRTKDGLEVTAPSATYDSTTEVILMPGPVRFTKGRMTGDGTGGRYDRKQELFQLEEQAHVVVAADADGHGSLDARANRLTAARLEKFTRLDEQASIVTETETLKGNTATLYFTDDEQHLKLVDLQGQASVEPAQPDGARAVMRGDQISLSFQPAANILSRSTLTGNATATLAGGRTIAAPWLDIVLAADGTTVVGIDARPAVTVTLPASGDVPDRRIDAATLAARGAEGRGLESARFDAAAGGRVRFTERSTRSGTERQTTALSRVLVLLLDGSLDAVTDAEFRGSVDFRSGDSKATGEWGKYNAKTETLELTQQAGDVTKPVVEQEGLWVSAPVVTLGVNTQNLHARGGVATRFRPAAGRNGRSRSLFEAERDVIGAADTLAYDGASRGATYTGSATAPAELRQDDGSTVTGEVIVVDDAKGRLTATRQVRTRFRAAEAGPDGSAGAAPGLYVVTSDAFEYDDDTRRAVHRGAPAKLDSDGRMVEGQEIVMFMARESQALERLTAAGKVFAIFDKDHEAKGDRLEFTAATGLYVLTGKPVEVVAPAEQGGCHRTVGAVAHFNRETRLVSWPALPDGRDRGVQSEPWTCGKSIR